MRKNLVVDMAAVEEMVLVIENNGDLYRNSIKYIIANLQKKYAKGKFDIELAPKAFESVVVEACKQYHAQYGSPNEKYYTVFNPATREAIAKDLVKGYLEEIQGL